MGRRTELGFVGQIWLFCRTYLASDKSDFVGHIEPSQGASAQTS